MTRDSLWLAFEFINDVESQFPIVYSRFKDGNLQIRESTTTTTTTNYDQHDDDDDED